MAKKPKTPKRFRTPTLPPSPAAVEKGSHRVPAAQFNSAAIGTVHAEAEASIPDELANAHKVIEADAPSVQIDLEALWRDAEAARLAWEVARKKCDDERSALEREREVVGEESK